MIPIRKKGLLIAKKDSLFLEILRVKAFTQWLKSQNEIHEFYKMLLEMLYIPFCRSWLKFVKFGTLIALVKDKPFIEKLFVKEGLSYISPPLYNVCCSPNTDRSGIRGLYSSCNYYFMEENNVLVL